VYSQARYSLNVSNVPGHQFQVEVHGGGSDLQVGIGEAAPARLEIGRDFTVAAGDVLVVPKTVIAGSTRSEMFFKCRSRFGEQKVPLYSSPIVTTLAN